MTDEMNYPDRPGPPREVSEDAAAREWAEAAMMALETPLERHRDELSNCLKEVIANTVREAQEQARAEERERAARIADGYTDTKPVSGQHAPIVATVMNDTAEKIAAAVRNPEAPNE